MAGQAGSQAGADRPGSRSVVAMASWRVEPGRPEGGASGDPACARGVQGDVGEDRPQGCARDRAADALGLVSAGALQVAAGAGDAGAAGGAQAAAEAAARRGDERARDLAELRGEGRPDDGAWLRGPGAYIGRGAADPAGDRRR